MSSNFNLLNFLPTDLKKIKVHNLPKLCAEIREFIKENILKSSGHLSSNLATIELTVALVYLLDLNKDRLLFDIGHQAYTYKILTGRGSGFLNFIERKISGFTSYTESKYDFFEAGHASQSLSALAGFVLTNPLNKNVAVIGDGALNAGIAFEGLNTLSGYNLPGTVIINNNKCSIVENVGAFRHTLNDPNKARAYFEALGYQFFYLKEGNDVVALIDTLKTVLKVQKPVVFLIETIKGKGLVEAVSDVSGKYHSYSSSTQPQTPYIMGKVISEFAKLRDFYLIESGMELGNFTKDFKEKYPDRFIDSGIAEGNSAMLAASLALNKRKVILPYYTTFIQRSLDYLLSDIARVNLDATLLLNSAFLANRDPSTHQGTYFTKLLSCFPNTKVFACGLDTDYATLLSSTFDLPGLKAIAYPKLPLNEDLSPETFSIKFEKEPFWQTLKTGKDTLVLSYGPILKEIYQNLNQDFTLVNARLISQIEDEESFLEQVEKHTKIVVVEEACSLLYGLVLDFLNRHNLNKKVIPLNLDNCLISEKTRAELLKDFKLTLTDIKAAIEN